MSEVRRVLLANGQYIEIVQETGSSTDSVMSQNAVTTALNGKANTTHTHAASDIISGTFGSAKIADGAITSGKLATNAVTTATVADGAITRAKLASDVPISVTQYETVTVTGVCSDGSPIAGKQLSIGGYLYEFDSNGVVSANIPYGQAYTIRPIVNNFYFSNDFYVFTAATASRSITVNYSLIGYGAYIEDKQGRLYTSSDWSSGNNANANSVVVLTGTKNFRIALTGNYLAMHYEEDGWWDSILPKGDYTTDFFGAANTKLIVDKCQPLSGYAAGWCASYIFPNRVIKGYLPACGELFLAYQNKAAVNAALAKCGGTVMPTTSEGSNCWSSTFYGSGNGSSYFYVLNWYSGERGARSNIVYQLHVRPFGSY